MILPNVERTNGEECDWKTKTAKIVLFKTCQCSLPYLSVPPYLFEIFGELISEHWRLVQSIKPVKFICISEVLWDKHSFHFIYLTMPSE